MQFLELNYDTDTCLFHYGNGSVNRIFCIVIKILIELQKCRVHEYADGPIKLEKNNNSKWLNVIVITWVVRLYVDPRDNPRALASGLSYVQVDKHGKYRIYTFLR